MVGDSARLFYEFFAGGGMARLGLGEGWRCGFANDIDPAKAAAYRANFGDDHFHEGDVRAIRPDALPGRADLAWASFPCQDLSLAGRRGGMHAERSSSFFAFWFLMEALRREGRAPRLIVLENVPGLLTSAGGADFSALCETLAGGGYRFGALEIDAAHFLPQSRPRLFLVAAADEVDPGPLGAPAPEDGPFHSPGVRAAHARLPASLAARWVWWRLPAPPKRNTALVDLLEPKADAPWRPRAETTRLLSLMGPANRAKVTAARTAGGPVIGAAFRRTRIENGERVQRAEIRFDGLAGCLRTPGGGSSRQFVVEVAGRATRSRPLTPRETARLMGLPDEYRLPERATAALHVTGDGVAAPAVAWLREHVLDPLLARADAALGAAAE
ncbi:DNA (cytosine-5-)-methyltransferase [Marinicauda salina]|uniref:DNA (cytosine-5-)-methyltransferase n=1 Tax=Marinicauda salina TaxID=2135793 RepID=A0A2U2BV33_9PROT|nr:DNA cytosine methyltransferase [Marinicauda salina]PWE17824.1 DNA (cytosine-5-)-methyltransferase [Marinicauda salina]